MVGVVIGNYQLVRKLGEGGMGAVYLGQHTLLGRRAAIKVLLPALSARPDIVNRFFNEARAVTSISDPGIVQVFDFGYHSDGSAFIVMEYLEGEPLDRRLARHGRLPVHEALRLGRQLASSLAAAHAQHIVHRDLKPENIFLVPDAEVASGERSKILDFGIAKLSDDHPGHLKTHTGMLMGTPVYMSPEQCRGLPEIDHRSDIYALGCVLFHLMTGRPPFEGEAPGDILSAHIREPAPAPSSRAPEIPPAVDALVLRCLAKAPADRFSSMVELSAALGALQQAGSGLLSVAQSPYMVPTTWLPPGGMAPSAQPSPTPAPSLATPTTLGASSGQFAGGGGFATSAPGRSRRGLAIASGAVVGIAAILVVVVLSRRPEAPQPASQADPRSSESSSPSVAGSSGPRASEERGVASPAAPTEGPPPVAAVASDAGTTVVAAAAAGDTEARSGDDAPARRGADPSTGEPARPSGGASAGTSAGTKPGTSTSTGSTKRGSTHKHGAAPPPEPATTTPSSTPKPAPSCGKAVFAAVYNAAAPSKDAVRAALRSLKACHVAGSINDADYEETQAALVARL